MRKAIDIVESNCIAMVAVLGGPQLDKRGAYPTLSTKETDRSVSVMMNLVASSDGEISLLDIAEKIGVPMRELIPILQKLSSHGSITELTLIH